MNPLSNNVDHYSQVGYQLEMVYEPTHPGVQIRPLRLVLDAILCGPMCAGKTALCRVRHLVLVRASSSENISIKGRSQVVNSPHL